MKNVLIIGTGRIAGTKKNKDNFSHGFFYSQNLNFNILACVDTNNSALRKFQKIWKIQYAFNNIDDLIKSKLRFDIVDVCFDISGNYLFIKKILELRSKIYIFEKPFYFEENITKKIYLIFKKKNKVLLVNYPRLYEKYFIKNKIIKVDPDLKKLEKIVFFYSNGLVNNCSHFLIILIKYFNNFKILKNTIIKYEKNNYDFTLLINNKIHVHFISINSKNLSVFEGNFYFKNKFVSLLQNENYLQVRQKSNLPNINSHNEMNFSNIIKIDKEKNYLTSIFNFILSKNFTKKNFNKINENIIKLNKVLTDIQNIS